MNEFYEIYPVVCNNNNVLRIIIGQQPYKQQLNNINFSVNPTTSSVTLYQQLNNIAFLVNDWIKIQDSLEMVFNLLFGKDEAIPALALLKKKNITPSAFAESLFFKTGTLFVNRFIGDVDQKKIILSFIKDPTYKNYTIYVLFTGEKAFKNFGALPTNVSKAKAIHPSSVNLNITNKINRQQTYTDCWYLCNNNSLVLKDQSFNISLFRIF